MRSKQLIPYYGEFLLVPWALELSIIEPCDYACAYCFAILGDRGRKYYKSKGGGSHANGVRQTLNLLKDYRKRNTFEAYLLQEQYPVLLSNRTDPFGRKNKSQTIAILEILKELDIPVAFQTKGFIDLRDFDKVMDIVKPSWWYITISQDDDNIRKRIEPGATTIEHRYELMNELVRRGHKVCLGWNPFVPEWVTDTHLFLQKAWDSGARQIAIHPLYLNDSNVRQMTEREKAGIHGGDLEWWNKIQGKKRIPIDWWQPLKDAHQASIDIGFKHITYEPHQNTDPWEDTLPLYKKTMPTIQQFAAHCQKTMTIGDPLFFEEWLSWCLPKLPDIETSLGYTITTKSWSATKHIMESEGWEKWRTRMSYCDLLRICWQHFTRLPSLTPYANYSFCEAWYADKSNIIDEFGLPVMTFAPSGHPIERMEGWIYA